MKLTCTECGEPITGTPQHTLEVEINKIVDGIEQDYSVEKHFCSDECKKDYEEYILDKNKKQING